MLNADEIREKMKDRRPGIVAKKTGLSTVTIHYFMKGRSGSYATVKKLSDYFDSLGG